MHGKLIASRTELEDEKEAINMGSGRGGGPVHTPKKVGLAKLRLMGRLAWRDVADKENYIMGDIS